MVQNWRLAIGSKGNNSYVRLKYANNPYNANDFKVQEMPRVTVYTYQMEIESVDKDNEKNLLPGSEFSVLDENGEVSNRYQYNAFETKFGKKEGAN